MWNKRKFLLLIIACAIGCSDYNLQKHDLPVEAGVTAPEIEVDPLSHSFGALNAGSETSDVFITIENIGNGELNISDIYLQGGTSNFTLTSVPVGVVESRSDVSLVVTYSPGTYETNTDIVSILSNDEDEPVIEVYLDGSGDAPVIRVTPSSYDFGSVLIGCEDSLGILVENIGNADLEITDLEYFVSLPVDFAIEDFESEDGPLPWTLGPSDWVHLKIDYIPLDVLDDGAWLEITSNDPSSPVTLSEHEGVGGYDTLIVDSFTQDGDSTVDILFVVDNSGSMSSNQSNLKNNFDAFMAVFVSAGVDYQVALITTDQSEFVGDVINSSTPDPITAFEDQVDLIGYHGAAIEKGLWYAYESTSTGDASSSSSTGFLRPSARLVVVYISDEPDASTNTSAYGGGSSTLTPADYAAQLQSLKTSSELVVAHAVAGDYPSGCTSNGSAQFGDGYYDVVNLLGGTFMSICAADWSVTMDTLARESMSQLSFELSDEPIEDTISVAVNGYTSVDWSYDSSLNAIVFSVAPADESIIDVTFAPWADCE